MQVEKYQIKIKCGVPMILLFSESCTKGYTALHAHEYIVRSCFKNIDPFQMGIEAQDQIENLKHLLTLVDNSHKVLSMMFNDVLEAPLWVKGYSQLLSVEKAPHDRKKFAKKGLMHNYSLFSISFQNGVTGATITDPNIPLSIGQSYHFEKSNLTNSIKIKGVKSLIQSQKNLMA
jgi:hypothetical protein